MRRPPRASISPTARAALIGLVLGGVLVTARGTASAQTTTPTSPPNTSTSSPQPEPTPPPAALPSAPPGPATPPLEAGDTAPPGAIQPLATPSSTSAPPPGLPPSTIAQESLGSVPPREKRPRVYETRWFWGAVGVVVITVAIVLVLSLNTNGPSTPNTTLGDMRAF